MATRKKKVKTSTSSSVVSNLREYRRKRDFDRTAEPSGADDRASSSGRLFVIQKHAARNLHYDLRLEFDGVLKSWAVPKGPSLDPAQKPLAVLVEDHPMAYARFEGVIPKGEYGGGSVMVWDIGEWEPLTDPVEGFAKGDLKFRLRGEKLRGAWVLARMSGDAGADGKNWLLIKKKDAESRSIGSFNVLGELPRSVLSDRTLDDIAADPEAVWTEGREQPIQSKRGKGHKTKRGASKKTTGKGTLSFDPSQLSKARTATQPSAMKPQLATIASAAPEGDDWLHEIKLDGYRLIGVIDNGSVTLLTRNGHDWTDRFKSVAAAMERLPIDQAIVDGEVVVLDARGISDFGALQNAFRGYTRRPFTYFLFDIPYAQGCDLRNTPLIERKALLNRIVQGAPLAAPTVQYCDHILGNGATVFQQAAEAGLEGIISKQAGAVYESRRTHSWVKVKATLRQEFVIGGFTDPSGSRSGFGALVLGHYNDDNELVYCGRVGTGFSDHALNLIAKELAPLVCAEPPFVNGEVDPEFKSLHWVRPELVAEVEFTAWTHENLLRHPSFRGLRADIDPAEVIREDAAVANRASNDRKRTQAKTPIKAVAPTKVVKTPGSPEDVAVADVRISNPHRTVYPDDGVTKLAVAMYYEKVAPWMLPYVANRPLSLVRCPLGLAGDAFFQRHLGDGFPKSIKGLEINIDDTGQQGLMIVDTNGLLSLAQMGVLEIHIWGCRADNIEKPDMLVFDLDPGPGIEWEHIVESARFVRDYLDDVGLRSFVKTTGGNGLHVVSPIGRRATWDEAKAFTRAIADDLVRIAPLNFVATMAKTLRQHRIFVDYLRNLRGATFVAPYSTRARNGACVSTPLEWGELSADAPASRYTVSTVPDRMADLPDDPWAGFDTVRQSITAAMKRKFKLS